MSDYNNLLLKCNDHTQAAYDHTSLNNLFTQKHFGNHNTKAYSIYSNREVTLIEQSQVILYAKYKIRKINDGITA